MPSQLVFDYNIHSNYYVASNQRGQLYLDRFDKDRPIGLEKISVPAILAQCHHRVRSLSLDWINHLLYLINTDLNHIEVIKLLKPNKVLVFAENLHEAQDIKVNPIESWIVWSEKGQIIRMSQDGSERKLITDQVIMPMGLTIDYLSQQIYWLDAKLHSLNSIHFDGSNQRIILNSEQYLGHPFDIDVFDNTVFWSDLHTGSVYVTDKFGRNSGIYELFTNNRLRHQNVTYLDTIDSYKQPRNESYDCPLNCPYRCNATLSCICPEPYVLCSDMNGDDHQCLKHCSNVVNTMSKKIFSFLHIASLLIILMIILFVFIKCCQKIRKFR